MTPLFNHQKEFLALAPDKHALVWETGTGKSRTAIEWANLKSENSLVIQFGVLIIVPKGLKTQWEHVVKQWQLNTPRILILTKEEFKKKYKEIGRDDAVIVDECHYFLGMKSALSKALTAYFKAYGILYRLFLSATVYRSSPWDIYRLMELLELPGRPNWPAWSREFFFQVRMGGRMVPLPRKGMEVPLAGYVRLVGSIVRMDECLDVPPQNFEVEYFTMTPEQKKGIKEAYDPLPIVQFTKEHQISGGTLKGDEYNEDKEFKSDKLDRLVEIANENKKMIIVSRYKHEIRSIFVALKKENPKRDIYIIDGSVSGEDRANILTLCRLKSEYVLIVNAACAEGWELADCPLMIFYSYDFSLLKYIQMLGRIQRINNIKKNTYLSLVVKDTIDEDIYKTITVDKMDFHLEVYRK